MKRIGFTTLSWFYILDPDRKLAFSIKIIANSEPSTNDSYIAFEHSIISFTLI